MTDAPQIRTLIDFSRADEHRQWSSVNDTVMGGRSNSRLRHDGHHSVFSGALSVENNGGFASVRRTWPEPGSFDTIHLRVMGDGRRYQLRLRTSNDFDGMAWSRPFETSSGAWQALTMTADEFVPVFRGRIVSGAEPLDLNQIRQLGLMLADKRPGDFSLRLDYLGVSSSTTESVTTDSASVSSSP